MITAHWKMHELRRWHLGVTFVTSSDISGSFLTLVQQIWTETHFTMQRSFASLTVLGAGEWSFGRFFAGRGGMSLLYVTSGCDGWKLLQRAMASVTLALRGKFRPKETGDAELTGSFRPAKPAENSPDSTPKSRLDNALAGCCKTPDYDADSTKNNDLRQVCLL